MGGEDESMNRENLVIFQCGLPRGHTCDDKGPEICGGEDENGNVWVGLAKEMKFRNGCTWGSVSCSICGTAAYQGAYWYDLP